MKGEGVSITSPYHAFTYFKKLINGMEEIHLLSLLAGKG
jgi:hypothetical protein